MKLLKSRKVWFGPSIFWWSLIVISSEIATVFANPQHNGKTAEAIPNNQTAPSSDSKGGDSPLDIKNFKNGISVVHELNIDEPVVEPPIEDSLKDDQSTQCAEESLRKGEGEIGSSDVDLCKTVSPQCLHDLLKKVMEDPTKHVSGKDYSCILINLLQRNADYSVKVSTLESHLQQTRSELTALTTEVETHSKKFIGADQWGTLLDNMESSLGEMNAFKKLEKKIDDCTENQKSLMSKHNDEHLLLVDMISNNSKNLEEIRGIYNITTESYKEHAKSFEEALNMLEIIGENWTRISKSVEILDSQTSARKVEVDEKIKEISLQIHLLHVRISNETTRASLSESSLHKDLETKLTTLENSLKYAWGKYFHEFKNDSSKAYNNLEENWANYKLKINAELENATKSCVQIIDSMESGLKSKIENEASRSIKMEKSLSDFVNTQTVINSELKSNFTNEKKKISTIEKEFKKVIEEHKFKLLNLEADFITQLKVESLRTKGAEAQLSTFINNEVDKLKKYEGSLRKDLDKLSDTLIKESKRALGAESKLEKQISEEVSRATIYEEGLLSNLNQELKRAAEREEQLHTLTKANAGNIVKFDDELKQFKTEFEKEVEERAEIFNISTKLFQDQTTKLTELESNFKSSLTRERSKVEGIEKEIETRFQAIENRASESDKNILQDITYHNDKFEQAIFLSMNMTKELFTLFGELKLHQEQNFTLITDKFTSVETLVATEVKNLNSVINQVEADSINYLTTLASNINTKLETANKTVTQKLEEIELDIKALKSPPKPLPQQGGVFNRLVGFFGGNSRRPNNQQNSTRASKKNADEDKGKKVVQLLGKGDEAKNTRSRLRVEDVFSMSEDEFLGTLGDDSPTPSASRSRKLTETNERSLPLIVRKVSKVSKTFG